MELRSDIMNPVGSFEFEMDKDARNAPYVFKHEELNKILTFVHTLCDGSGDDVLSFLKSTVCTPWQKPGQALVLTGPDGCGKSPLVRLIENLIGRLKVQCLDPSNMRGLSPESFLIVCTENSARALSQAYDRGLLKSIIADSHFSFKQPNNQTLVAKSYHRVLICTHTINGTLANSRHIRHIRCGNGLVGDDVLFDDLHRLMEDRDVLHTFWDYLKKDRWGCLRRKLRVRAIVLYWLKLTEQLMEPGNAAFARDHAEHEAMWE